MKIFTAFSWIPHLDYSSKELFLERILCSDLINLVYILIPSSNALFFNNVSWGYFRVCPEWHLLKEIFPINQFVNLDLKFHHVRQISRDNNFLYALDCKI